MRRMMARLRARASERKSSQARVLLSLDGPARPVWSPRDYGAFATEGYARNPVAFRCVRLLSEAAASIPLRALRSGRSAHDDDPAAQLMRRPNPEQSGPELVETLIGHLQVAGDAYLEGAALEGEMRALYALRPDRVSVIPGPQGWPAGWEYRVGRKATRLMRDSATGRAPVLHLKIFSAADDHYGQSPMEPAAVAMDIHAAQGAWAKALLDNAARPSGALVYRGGDGVDRLTPDQFDRLKAELEASHAGPRAAGRPLLLEGGLEWTPFGLSPADMDFVAAKQAAAREIASAFGVPPMLLGLPGDNTYANYKEANLAFWRQTVLPLARKTARALEAWLQPWFGSDLRIDASADDTPALADERAALWRALTDADFLTDRERRALAGLPEEPAT